MTVIAQVYIVFPLNCIEVNSVLALVIGSFSILGAQSLYSKPLSSNIAAIQGFVAQMAPEMEETGHFHLVDLARHVLSGWLPE